MDFVRSHFGKMKLWPVEQFWLTFFPDQLQISADLEKSEPKVFNWSEFHFSEVTSYKIHTLESPSANQENKKKIINHLFY